MASHDPVALRLQRLDLQAQSLVLAALAADGDENNIVKPSTVTALFNDFALPAPAKVGNVFTALKGKKFVTPAPGHGSYKVTPLGRDAVAEKMSGLDLVALSQRARPRTRPSSARLRPPWCRSRSRRPRSFSRSGASSRTTPSTATCSA